MNEAREHALVRALRIALVIVGIFPFFVPLLSRVMCPRASEILYLLFAPVCHRNPARTLSIAGELMPICSRCAGIFAGFVTGGVLPRPRLGVRACLAVGFVASVVMVIDVVTQDLGLRPMWHLTRLLTGILWGHVFALGALALGRDVVVPRLRATSSA